MIIHIGVVIFANKEKIIENSPSISELIFKKNNGKEIYIAIVVGFNKAFLIDICFLSLVIQYVPKVKITIFIVITKIEEYAITIGSFGYNACINGKPKKPTLPHIEHAHNTLTLLLLKFFLKIKTINNPNNICKAKVTKKKYNMFNAVCLSKSTFKNELITMHGPQT